MIYLLTIDIIHGNKTIAKVPLDGYNKDKMQGGQLMENDKNINTVELDADGDGVIDTVYVDLDGDGTLDAAYIDTDGDGRADTILLDTDGDGKPDTLLFDADGDGEFESETAIDSDS